MSIINHEHKHIFIHNPKTAGTSMESCEWVGGKGHRTARQLVPQAPDYWSWGFVRHPLDRIVSAYYGLRLNAEHITPDVDCMTFAEYVRHLHDNPVLRPSPCEEAREILLRQDERPLAPVRRCIEPVAHGAGFAAAILLLQDDECHVIQVAIRRQMRRSLGVVLRR